MIPIQQNIDVKYCDVRLAPISPYMVNLISKESWFQTPVSSTGIGYQPDSRGQGYINQVEHSGQKVDDNIYRILEKQARRWLVVDLVVM